MDKYIVRPDDDDDDEGEGPRHTYYQSEKILGKLYRAVNEQRIWAENIKITDTEDVNFWETFLHGVEAKMVNELGGDLNWSHRRDEAERIRHA